MGERESGCVADTKRGLNQKPNQAGLLLCRGHAQWALNQVSGSIPAEKSGGRNDISGIEDTSVASSA